MSTIDTEDIITNHHCCSGGGHLVGCNGPEGDYCLIITLADEIDALRAKLEAVGAISGPVDDAEGWPDEDAARFLDHERQQRAAVDDPAEPCGHLRECPPHRYPDGMPDEVIAWRCAKCGETVRE